MRGSTGNLGARSSESWQVMASNDRWGEDRRIGELSAMNKWRVCLSRLRGLMPKARGLVGRSGRCETVNLGLWHAMVRRA